MIETLIFYLVAACVVIAFGAMIQGGQVIEGALYRVYSNAGPPTDGSSGTFAGAAEVGALLTDTTNGVLYQNVGTKAAPTWEPAGGGASDTVEVRNETGGTLSEGDLVYLSGYDETQNKFNIVLADADVTGRRAEYVLRADILNNANGVVFKTHRETGQNTDTTAEGDPVYLSTTAGGWTITDPTDLDPNGISQVVGYVAIVHASTGVVEFNVRAAHQIGTNEYQDNSVTTPKMSINLPFTLALPFTLGNRSGAQSDGVLIGKLDRQAVDAAIQEDDSGASFTDETADANSAGANDVQIPDPFDTDDALFIGMNNIFSAVAINIGTQGVGDAEEAETVWEYSKGSDTWGTLTEVEDTTVALSGTTGIKILSFLPPSDWAVDTINSQGPFFYIRMRATADDVYNTTQPLVTQIWCQELIVGQGVVVPFTGSISAVDLAALVKSATNDNTELLLINRTQGTFVQLTWTGGDEMDRVTGLALAVTAGDEIVLHMITEDGSTEFADAQLIMQIDV